MTLILLFKPSEAALLTGFEIVEDAVVPGLQAFAQTLEGIEARAFEAFDYVLEIFRSRLDGAALVEQFEVLDHEIRLEEPFVDIHDALQHLPLLRRELWLMPEPFSLAFPC